MERFGLVAGQEIDHNAARNLRKRDATKNHPNQGVVQSSCRSNPFLLFLSRPDRLSHRKSKQRPVWSKRSASWTPRAVAPLPACCRQRKLYWKKGAAVSEDFAKFPFRSFKQLRNWFAQRSAPKLIFAYGCEVVNARNIDLIQVSYHSSQQESHQKSKHKNFDLIDWV